VLVASSLAAFVGARRVVRPGQPLATYALGDDKAAALAVLLPYRPPAALCVVGPKPPLCFFVEPQPGQSNDSGWTLFSCSYRAGQFLQFARLYLLPRILQQRYVVVKHVLHRGFIGPVRCAALG